MPSKDFLDNFELPNKDKEANKKKAFLDNFEIVEPPQQAPQSISNTSPLEVEKNKTWLGDFATGGRISLNALEKAGKKGLSYIAPTQGLREKYSKQYEDAAREGRLLKAKINNKVAGFAGEMILDPLNIPFIGWAGKAVSTGLKGANKAKQIAKQAGFWGGYGAGTGLIRDFGNEDVNSGDYLNNAIINATISGGLGGIVASGLPSKAIQKGLDKIKGSVANPVIENIVNKGSNLNQNIVTPFLDKTLNTPIGNQIGSAALGAGAGALMSDDKQMGALTGAGVGLGIKNAGAIGQWIYRNQEVKDKLLDLAKKSGELSDVVKTQQKQLETTAILKGTKSKEYQQGLKELEELKISEGIKSPMYKAGSQRILDEARSSSDGFKEITGSLGNTRMLFSNTLSKDYQKIRDSHIVELNNIQKDVEALQGALKETFGKSGLLGDKNLYLYATGDKSVKIPENAKKTIDSLRAKVDNNMKELESYGWLPKDSAKEFEGSYLSRIYDNGFIKNTLNNDGKMGLDKLYKRGQEVKVSSAEYKRLVQEGKVSKYGEGGFSKGFYVEPKEGAKVGKDGKITLRKDYTFKERQEMGESLDLADIFAKTLYKQNEQIATIKFLNEVKKYGDALSKQTGQRQLILDIAELQKKGVTDLTLPSVAREMGFEKLGSNFGVLSGTYIRRDVAFDMQRTYQRLSNVSALFGDSTIGKLHKAGLSGWKKAKTVYNAKAHINNVMSNFALLDLYGITYNNPLRMVKEISKNINVISRAGDYKKLLSKAEVGSLTQKEYKELAGLKKIMGDFDEASSVGLFGRGRHIDVIDAPTGIKGKVGDVLKKAESAYESEDYVARLTAFKILKERGYTAEQAKDMVTKIVPDYTGYLPPAIAKLRDVGIAPFISWTYYVIPNMMKQLTTGAGAFRAMRAVASLYALEHLLVGGEDIEKPLNNGAKYINIAKDGDKVTRVKVDRMMPYLELLNDPINVASGLVASPLRQVWNDIDSIGKHKPLVRDFDGRPVTNQNKSPLAQGIDIAKHYATTLSPIPQQVFSGFDVIDSILRDDEQRKRSKVYIPRSTNQEILNFLGINTSNYSQTGAKRERELRRKLLEEKKK